MYVCMYVCKYESNACHIYVYDQVIHCILYGERVRLDGVSWEMGQCMFWHLGIL